MGSGECRRHGKMVAGGGVRNERNLRDRPSPQSCAPEAAPEGFGRGMPDRRLLPPLQGGGVFDSPRPGVPLRSTPGYYLTVPPALHTDVLA